MADGYVLLYVRGAPENDNKVGQILGEFEKLKIKHRVVDLSEEISLYGNRMPLEGFFALDLSGVGDVKVPLTPLAVAEDKIFNGSDEILESLDYLAKNYAEV